MPSKTKGLWLRTADNLLAVGPDELSATHPDSKAVDSTVYDTDFMETLPRKSEWG